MRKGLTLCGWADKKGLLGLKKGLDNMSEILINDYSKAVKQSFSGSISQGRFMREAFKAAGYDRFPTTSDEDYAKKICNGSKPITLDMKNGFPKPYHIEELALYLGKKIDNAKVKTLAAFFGIANDSVDKDKLCKAIASQFFLYVEGGGEKKPEENTVSDNYLRLLAGTIDECMLGYPLHSGDKAWVINGQRARAYTKSFYEIFEHIWCIRNNGNVNWHNRKLICQSTDTQYIKVETVEIDVPDTAPGENVEIKIKVDPRGKENTFLSNWVMIDEEGKNCYPNDDTLFDFTVTVINKSRRATEAM